MLRFFVVLLALLSYHFTPRSALAQVADGIPCADSLPLPVARKLSFNISDTLIHSLHDISLDMPTISLPEPQWGKNHYRVRGKHFIAPAVLFGLGVTGVTMARVQVLNEMIRNNFIDVQRYHFDDYLQYAPFTMPYILKLCGVKSRHNYGEYTILLATSYASMGIMVNALKYTVRRERPDGSSRNSFPSGHTATAFMGAELLRSEFWEVSPWIGVAGYSLASTIGIMRVYNNRHWVTDVLAGAGIGILSVRIAYWTLPTFQRWFWGEKKARRKSPGQGYASLTPYYNGSQLGTAFSLCF